MTFKRHLLFTQQFSNAQEEINQLNGYVTQKFTDTVFAANLPEDFDAVKLKQATTEPPAMLDEISALVIDAWAGYMLKLQNQTNESTEEPVSWGSPQFNWPGNPVNAGAPRPAVEELPKINTVGITPAPTSQKMKGTIALGLIIVSGPTSDLAFSAQKKTQILQEVAEGYQFLAEEGKKANVGITFMYSIYMMTIDAVPNNKCDNYYTCESVFRDPVLKQLGYPPGHDSCVKFVEDLRKNKQTDWAFMAFVSKYPHVGVHGYSRGVNLFMYEDKNGSLVGFSNIFAHETCHIFGAADEYAPACDCAPSGIDRIPNNNCETCTGVFQKIPCLMKDVTLSLCPWTKGQIGWTNPNINSDVSVIPTQKGLQIGYRNANNHVSLIYFFGDKSEYDDLSLMKTQAPLAQGNPCLLFFNDSLQLHSVYRDVENQVSDIYYDKLTTWQYQNLNALAPLAPLAASDPFAIALLGAREHHNIYRDINNQISDIYYNLDTNRWSYQNWSKMVEGAGLAKGKPFTLFATGPDGTENDYSYYRNQDDQIEVIASNKNIGLAHYNITLKAPGAELAYSDPFCIIYSGQLHSFYRNPGSGISDIYWNGTWNYLNLFNLVKGASLAAGNPFALVYNQQLNIFYKTATGQISRINYNSNTNKWQYRNIFSQVPKINLPKAVSDPFAAEITVNNQLELHILYRDVNNQVSDIYWNGTSWQYLCFTV